MNDTTIFAATMVTMIVSFGIFMFVAMYKDHQEHKKNYPNLFK